MRKSQAIALLEDTGPEGVRQTYNHTKKGCYCVLGRVNTDPENDQGVAELDDDNWAIIGLASECSTTMSAGLAGLYGREESYLQLNNLMTDPSTGFKRMGAARQGTHTGIWIYTTDRPD